MSTNTNKKHIMNNTDIHYKLLEKLRRKNYFLCTHDVIKQFGKYTHSTEKLDYFTNLYPNLHSITKNNLKKISEMLNVDWKYGIRYYVKRGEIFANGYLIYGISSQKHIINYERYETRSKAAGQTFIHVGKYRLQANKLIRDDLVVRSEDIDAMRKLLEVVKSLELERTIFKYI